jgi:hypothetical protein
MWTLYVFNSLVEYAIQFENCPTALFFAKAIFVSVENTQQKTPAARKFQLYRQRELQIIFKKQSVLNANSPG